MLFRSLCLQLASLSLAAEQEPAGAGAESCGSTEEKEKEELGCAGGGERSGAIKGKRSGQRNEKTLAAEV